MGVLPLVQRNGLLPAIQPRLVPGALAYWPMDTFDSSTGAVANAMTGTALSPNIYRGSRRLFSYGSAFWSVTSATVVDDAADDPNGIPEASTLNGSAGWSLGCLGSDTVPAGTYALAINAKSNTGSNQSFAFSPNSGSTRSSRTATTAWQRFSYDFTLLSTTAISDFLLLDVNGSTPANLQIVDFELYAGSSDLGPASQVGHLYLGRSPASAPALSGGWIDCSSGGFGVVQLPYASSANIATYTVMAFGSKVSTGSSANLHAILSNITDYLQFTAMLENGGFPIEEFSGTTQVMGSQNIPNLWPALNSGPHVFTFQFDGALFRVWIDDAQIWAGPFVSPYSLSPVTVVDMFMGAVTAPSNTGGYKFNGIVFYNSALSQSQISQNVTALKCRAAVSGIGVARKRIYLAEGDSITGSLTQPYPYQAAINLNPSCFGADWGTGGAGIATLNARLSTIQEVIPASLADTEVIVSLFIGVNDGPSWGTSANYAAAIQAYTSSWLAKGAKVVLCTLLPSTEPGYNAWRNAINAIIYSWTPGQYYTSLADFAADPIMGIDGNGSTTGPWNTTYYIDGVHPQTAGSAILAKIIGSSINGL